MEGEGRRQTNAPLWKAEKRKTLYAAVPVQMAPRRDELHRRGHRLHNRRRAARRAPSGRISKTTITAAIPKDIAVRSAPGKPDRAPPRFGRLRGFSRRHRGAGDDPASLEQP